MRRSLALFSRNAQTRADLSAAAERAGLAVTVLSGDAQELARVAVGVVAVRAPGGLVGAAIRAGTPIKLAGPTTQWFTGLGTAVTGRAWSALTIEQATAQVGEHALLVKLADAKHRAFPARRFTSVSDLVAALERLQPGPDLELLGTPEWLDIDSEYRVFTRAREVTAWSAYRVQDDPWSPLLHTHHASFHEQAAEFVGEVLAELDDSSVPPAACLDAARLHDGRFVVLEANQSWAAGPYGCDPDGVLASVLAANAETDPRWTWAPPTGLPGA